MASSSRTRRVLPKLAFVAVASVAGANVASRVLEPLRGRPSGEDSSRVILSPFTGWEPIRTHSILTAELEHYRSPAGAATYDICVLGGSVAQTFAQVGAKRLAEKLREDRRFAGLEIAVHEDACAGYKQPQSVMALAHLLARGHEPDAVIQIDGFHEAALGWSNARLGASPAYPYLPDWGRATGGLELGPAIPANEERTTEALVRVWEESSISMQGMCAARGILYLHVLQPALPDAGTKPLTAKEIENGRADPIWVEGVQKLYPRLREAGERLAGREIAFLDATGLLRDHPEDVYADVCHFGEHGNEILADAVARALLDAMAR